MKKFSIIIPTYNVKDYIENAILSIQSQTFKDYEIIIVDDCSTDNGETINKIRKFDNICLIQNSTNLGAGGARNKGIETATGQYIIFLDPDDILYNDTVLENLNNIISNETPDLIYLGYTMVGSRNFTFIPNEQNCNKIYKLSSDKYTNAWSKCWNRQFLLDNSIVFPEHIIYEDVSFVFHAISKAKTYKIANFITHIYTSGRSGSNASKNQFRQARDTVTCIENLADLSSKIDVHDLPYLKERIEHEKSRLIARLDRILLDYFEPNK